jgi:NAD(P)-dependent dehydrogenase (short-subunit alcohol dehydrogenase family)
MREPDVCAKLKDNMSPNWLYGRTILITGGTSGVGLEAARAVRARGADIVIGSRDPARYASVATELGDHGVYPFIADLTNADQVDQQLDLLHRGGVEPTDVILSAAGGLEPLLRDLVRVTIGLRGLRGTALDKAHAAAREELALVVADTREFAMNVNCLAPSRLLDRLVPGMAAGGSVTFYSSLWSSLYPHPQVPIYYEAVAETKHAMEGQLEDLAGVWASRRITTAVISAGPIVNTRICRLLDRFCSDLMPPADRERWRSTYVTYGDLVEATLSVLGRAGPDSSGGLVRLYLPGPGEVVDHMGPDDPPMHHQVALALNAPKWAEESLTTLT